MKFSVSDGGLEKHYLAKDYFKLLKDTGYDADDVMLHRYDIGSPYRTESESDVKAYFGDIKEYIDGIGLEVFQTHAPFPSGTNLADEKAMMTSMRNAIIATSVLGGENIIIHPIMPYHYRLSFYKKARFDRNIRFYNELKPIAKEYGVKINLENMFSHTMLPPQRKCPIVLGETPEIIAMLDTLNSDVFGFCLDIGHFNLLRDDPINAIYELKGRITAVHLHDNDGMSDRHIMSGDGTMDWEEICKALAEVGFNGVYNFEVNTAMLEGGKSKIPQTLKDILAKAKSLPFAETDK